MKGSSGILSIPELREAYEHVERVARNLTHGGGAVSAESVETFREAWDEAFGKPITAQDAGAYLNFVAAGPATTVPGNQKGSRNGKTRKLTRQRGGMAPLDYQTRAGIDGVYGNFPPYVSRGFEVGVPQISQQTLCGKVDTTPQVTEMIGSNKPLQNGGGGGAVAKSKNNGRTTRSRRANRRTNSRTNRRTLKGGSNLILSTNPTSVIQDMSRAWHGQILPLSPSPVDTAFEKYLTK